MKNRNESTGNSLPVQTSNPLGYQFVPDGIRQITSVDTFDTLADQEKKRLNKLAQLCSQKCAMQLMLEELFRSRCRGAENVLSTLNHFEAEFNFLTRE